MTSRTGLRAWILPPLRPAELMTTELGWKGFLRARAQQLTAILLAPLAVVIGAVVVAIVVVIVAAVGFIAAVSGGSSSNSCQPAHAMAIVRQVDQSGQGYPVADASPTCTSGGPASTDGASFSGGS